MKTSPLSEQELYDLSIEIDLITSQLNLPDTEDPFEDELIDHYENYLERIITLLEDHITTL